MPACAELHLEGIEQFHELRGLVFPEKAAPGCVVEALAGCAEPWCLHGYPDAFTRSVRPEHLCCTRFSRDLIARLPDLVDESTHETGHVANYRHLDKRADELGPRHFWRLPERVSAALRRHGVEAHHHEPPFAHFHDLRASMRRKKKLLRERGQSLSGLRRAGLVDYLSRR